MFTKLSRTTLFLSLVLLASLVFVPTAYAFDGREGQSITIGKDEVITEDLYLTAQIVTVDGTIQGDLMIAAEDVTINGTVEGDLWVGGRSLTLNGSVGDDLFAGAAAVTLGSDAKVGDDVFVGSYGLEARSGSQVGGTILLAAYQGLLQGKVAEDVFAGANRLRIEGTVGGDVKADVGDAREPNVNPSIYSPDMPSVPMVPAGLTLGNEAQIEGNLQYTSRVEWNIARQKVAGTIEHLLPKVEEQVTAQVKDTPARQFAAWMFDNIRRLVTFIVIGLLLAWLLPVVVTRPASRLQSSPWPSLGWGLVIFIVFPFAALLALGVIIAVAVLMGALTLGSLVGAVLSLGGAGLSAAIAIYGLILSFLTKSAVAYLGGRWLLNRFHSEYAEKVVWSLLLGLVILALVFAIPYLGGLIEFFVMLFGLGALFLMVKDRYTPAAPTAPVAVTAATD